MKFEVQRDKSVGSKPDTNAPRVLLVSAQAERAEALISQFVRRNFRVDTTTSGEEAVRMVRTFTPHTVIVDPASLKAGMNGLTTLERLRSACPDCYIVLVAPTGDTDLVFRASKLGADEFLSLPLNGNAAEDIVSRLLQHRAPGDARKASDGGLHQPDFAMLFGASPKMEDVKLTIEKVADTNATVLIRGESGTGKEMVARMTYAQSARREKAFVKVNCAAIPYELLESELFGYEQGAFTGANRQKLGKFDQANSGTIFLDEISEMHPALQAKLLHVLQDGGFSRLGGKRDIAVDVRVLAATNKPLERAVEQGMFREDLFYRLNVVSIHIPPLRERREEIPVFLDFFLTKYSEYYNKQPPPFSELAVSRMMEYSWPGNIRELENMVKRYTIVGNEEQILRELATHKPIVSSTSSEADSSGFGMRGGAGAVTKIPPRSADESLSLLEIGRRAAMKAEREAIERVLLQTKWNRRQAAKILKVSYKALLNKLKLIEEQDGDKPEQKEA